MFAQFAGRHIKMSRAVSTREQLEDGLPSRVTIEGYVAMVRDMYVPNITMASFLHRTEGQRVAHGGWEAVQIVFDDGREAIIREQDDWSFTIWPDVETREDFQEEDFVTHNEADKPAPQNPTIRNY